MSERAVLEVIALGVEDAVAAQAGGADRLELVTDMAADGLTPPVETFTGIRAGLTGLRGPVEPRRFTRVELHYTISGAVPPEAVQRAIDLSRDKYCSVWHSMRQDIEFIVDFAVTEG